MSEFINLRSFGVEPNTKKDCVRQLFDALEIAKKMTNPVLKFETGRYDFSPEKALEKLYCISNHDEDALKRMVFPIIDFDNLVIDGGNSEFFFHGLITPFIIENSKNIILRNFSMDWERPLYSQGTVLDASKTNLVIKINPEYPYEVIRGKLFFKGEGWIQNLWGMLEIDKNKKTPCYQSNDNLNGTDILALEAELIEPGIISLKGEIKKVPEIGNYLVFRHGKRSNPGIFVKDSANIHIDSVNIYHAGGMGIIAQKSSEIFLNELNVCLKPASERVFTTCADATHFVNCRGNIYIDNCIFENQLDDSVNVHGIYVKFVEKIDEKIILASLEHSQHKGVEVFSAGDKVAFVDNKSLQSFAVGLVKKSTMLNIDLLQIEFKDNIPINLKAGNVIENTSWNPNLSIRNCIDRAHRARGFLITTSGNVLVENCTIHPAGAGIRISGDAGSWFESGAVKNIIISNNTFLDCNYISSGSSKAVIDIIPEIDKPASCTGEYHHNISIEKNIFKTFDIGILYACSVNGLIFSNNIIERTKNYPMHKQMKNIITLKACKNVKTSNNFLNNIDGDSSSIKLVNENENCLYIQ